MILFYLILCRNFAIADRKIARLSKLLQLSLLMTFAVRLKFVPLHPDYERD